MGKNLEYTCSEEDENTPLLKSDITQASSDRESDKVAFTRILAAYAVALLCVAGICTSVSSVQILAGTIPEFELNAWRFAFQMLTPLPFIIQQRASLKIEQSAWPLTALLFLSNVTFNATYFSAAIYLPVGTFSGLSNTSVIIINALLSVCIVKERRLHLYLAAGISSIAIILLIQPEPMLWNTSLHWNPPSNWTSPCQTQITHHNAWNYTSAPLAGEVDQQTQITHHNAYNYTSAPLAGEVDQQTQITHHNAYNYTSAPLAGEVDQQTQITHHNAYNYTSAPLAGEVDQQTQITHHNAYNYTSAPLAGEVDQQTQITHHNAYNYTSAPLAGEVDQQRDKQWLGYILLVISSLLMVLILCLVARLVQTVNPFVLGFWNGIVSTIVSLIIMGLKESPTLPSNPLCFGLLFVHAIGTALYAVNMPYCMQYIPPTVFAFIRSLQLVVLLVLQYTALSHVLPGLGNWLEILGAVLCIIGCMIGSLWQLIEEKTVRLKAR